LGKTLYEDRPLLTGSNQLLLRTSLPHNILITEFRQFVVLVKAKHGEEQIETDLQSEEDSTRSVKAKQPQSVRLSLGAPKGTAPRAVCRTPVSRSAPLVWP
jgi:hypothetical protein